MLIGVDHGNKQIKTVHCNPFVSGVKQSVTRPFGQNVLRYQNTYYTLSTERIPYRKDKTEDDRFFILTLFALAGEIEARGAYSSEVQRIQLAVGLPPAHFGAQVERFTQYFRQRGVIEFEMQGKPYSIYIEDAACFPQAYAAAATMLHTLVEEPKAVILDIGGFTADYTPTRNTFSSVFAFFDLVKMIRNIAIGNTTHTVTLNSPLNKPTILYSLVKSLDINAFPRC